MAATRSTRPSRGASAEEDLFLQTYDPSVFERPSVAVDVVLLSPFGGALHTLVLKRKDHPCKGKWALPGGFVHLEESLEQAADRALGTKTGLHGVFLEQLYTFGEPGRDPRTRIITVAYFALVPEQRLAEPLAADEEAKVVRLVVPWDGEEGGPVRIQDAKGNLLETAFDHDLILGAAVQRLRGKLDYTPVGYQLLPEAFTLYQLQKVHETVLGRRLNKDSFRRRMLATGELEPTGDSQTDVVHRPAALYRYIGR
jgi:8-oxo-dGTP diphosphatase